MKYFQSLPKIASSDYQGNQILMTNLLVRSEIIPSLLKNPLLYYNYDIQDGDTPESIADKYYGDSYRYWIVLFANQIFDPQWQWPMNQNLFNDYLVDKYANTVSSINHVSANTVTLGQVLAYTQSTIKDYILSTTTYDNVTSVTNTILQVIDANAYANALSKQGTSTANFGYGEIVTQTVTAYAQSIYDYEIQQNEANRNINIVNSAYVSQFEQQFKSLMSK